MEFNYTWLFGLYFDSEMSAISLAKLYHPASFSRLILDLVDLKGFFWLHDFKLHEQSM